MRLSGVLTTIRSGRGDTEIKGEILTRLIQLALRNIDSDEPRKRLRELLDLVDTVITRMTNRMSNRWAPYLAGYSKPCLLSQTRFNPEAFQMRLIDAEAAIIDDLKEESDLIGEKHAQGVTVFAARHPTLGKLVVVKLPDGSGVLVEIDE